MLLVTIFGSTISDMCEIKVETISTIALATTTPGANTASLPALDAGAQRVVSVMARIAPPS